MTKQLSDLYCKKISSYPGGQRRGLLACHWLLLFYNASKNRFLIGNTCFQLIATLQVNVTRYCFGILSNWLIETINIESH